MLCRLRRFGPAARQQVEDRHPHRDAVADLVDDDGAVDHGDLVTGTVDRLQLLLAAAREQRDVPQVTSVGGEE